MPLLLFVIQTAVDLGEVEWLSHDTLVNVQDVFASGLEVRGGIVRLGNEQLRRRTVINRNLGSESKRNGPWNRQAMDKENIITDKETRVRKTTVTVTLMAYKMITRHNRKSCRKETSARMTRCQDEVNLHTSRNLKTYLPFITPL